MLKLYTWATPNGRKVSIMLEELGLAYEVHSVNITTGEQLRPEFLALNANNKIPVLVDPEDERGDRLVLAESGAILIYLAEKTGSALLPASGLRRASTLQWLMFQMGGVGPMFGQLHHYRRYAANETYGLARYQAETRRLYSVLNARLEASPYLNGDAYSIADIASYPWVARHELHDLDWKTVPHVRRWFDAVGARPAVRRGMAVPAIPA
ncbi:glutathione S-transferase N-terminal domain-containing protein [Paraburkholderia sediminicola]|uniref:glutathione S-transferase family protein n=1 Tax=Paraburkholderia TaxID=1822464 RepID=UPI0015C52B5A|nr:glutathione S-transferase N-terminal domain-containing protein [Paraburkholderia madseniana]NPT70233.1 glutathione S-transferase family protein [Paraburkholderia madseniana]